MVSTPNAPGGLFEKIERESFDTCICKKISLDYNYGLDKIYTKAEIVKAKASPSFEREYCLKYLGLIGNVFSQQSLDNATKIGYTPSQINPNAKKSIVWIQGLAAPTLLSSLPNWSMVRYKSFMQRNTIDQTSQI